MKQNRILFIPLLVALANCSTVEPGHDQVIVQAQDTMTTAKTTFERLEKAEFETYSAFKASDPAKAAEVRTFVNKLRSDSGQWFTTANSLKEAYRLNPTAENKANLDKAMAILNAAITKSNEYLALLPKTG